MIGFLALPAPGDTLARELFDRLPAIALRHVLRCDRAHLSPAAAAALAPHQAALRAAARDPATRARAAAPFADLDLATCALALATPAVADEAARTLVALLAGAAPAPAVPITATCTLALVDRNPLRTIEAHPEKDGNALDLGGRTPAAWVAAITSALAAIAAALPALADELAVTLRRVVPVGFDAEAHRSCSYREAPGLVYLSLHPGTLTMAEAIIHETQHTKLHLLSWLDPVLTNPPDQLVASPARPDPRPLMGVLLAAHAFVPVAAFHHGLAAIDHPLARDPQFAARRAQVLAGNAAGLATLRAHANLTPTGARVLAALDALHAALS